MGASGSQIVHDALATVSPWTTQVRVENKCTTQVPIYLARNAAEPSATDAVEHIVPPSSTYAFNSGWLHEPRATLLIRTGVSEAKVIRITDTGRLMISLAPHGLRVESPDGIVIEDFDDPASVPGADTVPMMMRGETFSDEASQPAASRTGSEAVNEAAGHGKAPAAQADEQMEDLEAAAEDRSSEAPPPATLHPGSEAREVTAEHRVAPPAVPVGGEVADRSQEPQPSASGGAGSEAAEAPAQHSEAQAVALEQGGAAEQAAAAPASSTAVQGEGAGSQGP